MVRDEHWITVQEAARRLGVKDDAIRKRIQRGTLRSEKDPEDGRVYVYLDTAQDTAYDAAEDTSQAAVMLVEEMRDRIASLERMLDQEREARTEERRRHDTLMATFMQRLPELEPPQASPEPHGPETGSLAEEPEGTDARESEAGVQGRERSWWRRWFGFD